MNIKKYVTPAIVFWVIDADCITTSAPTVQFQAEGIGDIQKW